MKNRLKEKIRGGEVVVGSFLFTPSPTVMEIFGYSGFDFAIIDTEHAPLGPLDAVGLENVIRAAEALNRSLGDLWYSNLLGGGAG